MNIFKSFGIYAGGQALNSTIRFFLIPYYSYLLSVSDFGKVGMVWMLLPALSLFIGMGLTASVSLKYYKVKGELRENLLNFSFIATFLLFVCVGIVVFFAYSILEQFFLLDVPLSDYMKLVCAAYGAFLIDFILALFKIRIQPKKFFLFNTLYTVISIGFLLFFLVVLNRGFSGFIDGTLYGNVAMAVILVAVHIHSCKTFRIDLPHGLVSDLVRLSGPIVAGFAISYLITYSGRYVLAQVSTMADVGIYTMGTRFGDAFNLFFVNPFLTAVNPILFKLFAEDLEGFTHSMKKYFNIYLLCGAFLLLLANLTLEIVFRLFIHEQYTEGMLVAQISFWAILVFGLSQHVGTVNLVRERLRLIMLFSFCCGIVSLGMTYLFVPFMGGLGAVVASLVSYMLLLSMQFVSSQRAVYINYEGVKAILFTSSTLVAFFIQVSVDKVVSAFWIAMGFKVGIVVLFIYFVCRFRVYEEVNLLVDKIRERIG
ncbi:oligosaccharide flippase family protein [Selenomonas sp. CM52]|uniref:oligosaccharide flippase family protein n=1 Tax=Selenomonas sp. CM52 TaxID=936381 RepID=UPI00027C394F|nr:oligosaccharide flippase family protein [Selenomonas sp. CM52]EJU29946.1 polysaccharide biosynthesis protein [Selenomonas sp. CM52]